MTFDETTEHLTSNLQRAAAALLAHNDSLTVIVPLDSLLSTSYIVIGDNLALKRLCRVISGHIVPDDTPPRH